MSTAYGFDGVDIYENPEKMNVYCRDCEYSLCCDREESNPLRLQTTIDAIRLRNMIDDRVAPNVLELGYKDYEYSLEVMRVRETKKIEAQQKAMKNG